MIGIRKIIAKLKPAPNRRARHPHPTARFPDNYPLLRVLLNPRTALSYITDKLAIGSRPFLFAPFVGLSDEKKEEKKQKIMGACARIVSTTQWPNILKKVQTPQARAKPEREIIDNALRALNQHPQRLRIPCPRWLRLRIPFFTSRNTFSIWDLVRTKLVQRMQAIPEGYQHEPSPPTTSLVINIYSMNSADELAHLDAALSSRGISAKRLLVNPKCKANFTEADLSAYTKELNKILRPLLVRIGISDITINLKRWNILDHSLLTQETGQPPKVVNYKQLHKDVNEMPNDDILIHCFGGIQRSVTVAMAHLISHSKMTPSQASDTIQKKRPAARKIEKLPVESQLFLFYCWFQDPKKLKQLKNEKPNDEKPNEFFKNINQFLKLCDTLLDPNSPEYKNLAKRFAKSGADRESFNMEYKRTIEAFQSAMKELDITSTNEKRLSSRGKTWLEQKIKKVEILRESGAGPRIEYEAPKHSAESRPRTPQGLSDTESRPSSPENSSQRPQP